MKPIAFKATFSDMRQVKGRKVYQLTFEVPAEKVDEALEVLGGAPHSEKEVWCGITQLNPGAEPVNPRPPSAENGGQQNERIAQPTSAPHQPSRHAGEGAEANPTGIDPQSRPGGAKRSFNELAPAVQAGILCNDPVFRMYVSERIGRPVHSPEDAAVYVRQRCKVSSRSEIVEGDKSADYFAGIRADYDVWRRVVV